ncbi:hypothetical protein PSTG_12734 [Puccinia striiformis f. sp. tritici PST-78]|uniref:Uncharacterized protein n=1 Tax=Puccinia striiformis f. sp. tritici PST-78 TaxID=1165861 RepID=A0A0L0V3R4_9BASI|nr:hypothetical protein PSTG_12734 [Puccinia striiformis f. sp. tritici PST-78]
MSNSAYILVKRSQEIFSVVSVFEDMNQKYEFPSADLTSGPTDPDLTIEDMATKSEILKKLQSSLLPAIKEHITCLLKSVEDSEEECPHPDVDLTLRILSDLDQTLKTTVSSTLTLTDGSPLPDGKHDHRLEKLKSFRCSQLRIKVDCIISSVAQSVLECYTTFMQSCAMAILVTDPARDWNQASKSKQDIRILTADVIDSIDDTIAWSLASDWAIVRGGWLMALGEIDSLLEHFMQHANPSLGLTADLARLTVSSTEESDLSDQTIAQTRRIAAMERTAEVVNFTIPLVKLARILVKKLLKMIPKKRKSEPDNDINSETLQLFHSAFESMIWPLRIIMSRVRLVQYREQATLTINFRDRVLKSLNDLKKTLETASTLVASRLMPLLHGVEYASPASDFKAWSLTLEEPWDIVLDRLLDFVSSLQVEPEQPLEQAD